MTRLRTMLTGKIHRATVTGADVHYVGSITVDADLLAAADILPGESVDVACVDNGSRLRTYTIAGPAGSGIIQLNGAAARLVNVGDKVIIMAYNQFDDDSARSLKPHVVFVDDDNKILDLGSDPAGVPVETADLKPGYAS